MVLPSTLKPVCFSFLTSLGYSPPPYPAILYRYTVIILYVILYVAAAISAVLLLFFPFLLISHVPILLFVKYRAVRDIMAWTWLQEARDSTQCVNPGFTLQIQNSKSFNVGLVPFYSPPAIVALPVKGSDRQEATAKAESQSFLFLSFFCSQKNVQLNRTRKLKKKNTVQLCKDCYSC